MFKRVNMLKLLVGFVIMIYILVMNLLIYSVMLLGENFRKEMFCKIIFYFILINGML